MLKAKIWCSIYLWCTSRVLKKHRNLKFFWPLNKRMLYKPTYQQLLNYYLTLAMSSVTFIYYPFKRNPIHKKVRLWPLQVAERNYFRKLQTDSAPSSPTHRASTCQETCYHEQCSLWSNENIWYIKCHVDCWYDIYSEISTSLSKF